MRERQRLLDFPPGPPRAPAFAWALALALCAVPAATRAAPDTLLQRFPTPQGYTRLPLSPDGFGAWLRALPLLPAGSPVLAFDRALVLPADDPRLAAVAELEGAL